MRERSPQQFQRIPRPSSRPHPQAEEEKSAQPPRRPGLRPEGITREDLSQSTAEPVLDPIPQFNPTGLARAIAPHLYEQQQTSENPQPIPQFNPTGLARAIAPHLYEQQQASENPQPIPQPNPTGLARAIAPELYEQQQTSENSQPIPKPNPTGLARAIAPELYEQQQASENPQPIPQFNPTGLARAIAPELYEPQQAPDENFPPIPKRKPTGLARAIAPQLYGNSQSPETPATQDQLIDCTTQTKNLAIDDIVPSNNLEEAFPTQTPTTASPIYLAENVENSPLPQETQQLDQDQDFTQYYQEYVVNLIAEPEPGQEDSVRYVGALTGLYYKHGEGMVESDYTTYSTLQETRLETAGDECFYIRQSDGIRCYNDGDKMIPQVGDEDLRLRSSEVTANSPGIPTYDQERNSSAPIRLVHQQKPVPPQGRFPGITVEPLIEEVVPGTTVTYKLYRPPVLEENPPDYRWFVQNDEEQRVIHSAAPVFEGPSGRGRSIWRNAKWDFVGKHTVVCQVTKGQQQTAYTYEQVVREPGQLARETLEQTSEQDYIKFRASLEMKHLELARGGLPQQQAGENYITNSGSNPTTPSSLLNYNTYTLHSNRNAHRRRWYVIPKEPISIQNFHGYQQIAINGKQAYDLDSDDKQAEWVTMRENVYTIVCEEYNSQGELIGQTQYIQVIYSLPELVKLKNFQSHIQQVDRHIEKIQEGKEVPIRAVHLSSQNAISTPLALYMGPDSQNPERWQLVDLTPGVEKMEYGGDQIETALDDFAKGNEYTAGIIQLELRDPRQNGSVIQREIRTDGHSRLGAWAGGLSWGSLVLVGLGFLSLVIPGAQVATPYLFGGATVLGGTASALSLADELQDAQPESLSITIDILGIVSSVLDGGATLRAIRQGQAFQVAGINKFLVLGAFASDSGAMVLVSVDGWQQIEQLVDSDLSRSQKVEQVVRIVSNLALNGGLLAYSARDLPTFHQSGSTPAPTTSDAPTPGQRPQTPTTSDAPTPGQRPQTPTTSDTPTPETAPRMPEVPTDAPTPETAPRTPEVPTDAPPPETGRTDGTRRTPEIEVTDGTGRTPETEATDETGPTPETEVTGETGPTRETGRTDGTEATGETGSTRETEVTPLEMLANAREEFQNATFEIKRISGDSAGDSATEVIQINERLDIEPQRWQSLSPEKKADLVALSRELEGVPASSVRSDGEYIKINDALELTPDEFRQLRGNGHYEDLLKATNEYSQSGSFQQVSPESREFLNARIDLKTKRQQLSDVELRAYMASFDNNWKRLQDGVYKGHNNTPLMSQFTRFRKKTFKRISEQVEANLKEKLVLLDSEGKFFDTVAAGSEQPTSDYDVTFISAVSGDMSVEVEAVIEFNRLFRAEFGKESGTVFDTNVYTTGHMPGSAMGNRLNEVLALRKLEEYLRLPTKLEDAIDELADMPAGRSRDELTDKIAGMRELEPVLDDKIREQIEKINKLRRENPQNGKPELEFEDANVAQVSQQVRDVREQLGEEVNAERHRNRVGEDAKKQLLADQDVMALAKQRRNMTAEEWSRHRSETLADTDPSLEEATTARLDKADSIYNRAMEELDRTMVELNRMKQPGENSVLDSNNAPETDVTKIKAANKDAELEAYNRLYETYLVKAQEIRGQLEQYKKIRNGEIESDLTPQEISDRIDRLTIDLNEMQSKALFFANEAYHTGPAAEHVVLGQQLDLGIPLDIDQYLVSINEQLGFAMEQVTADKQLGTALWKSAKYLDRVNNALREIEDKFSDLYHSAFDSATQEQIRKMQDLFDELLLIKKGEGRYYGMNDSAKAEAAERVAHEKGFEVNSIEELRQKIMEFNRQINSQIRNNRLQQYNTSPSELENWSPYEPNREMSQTPSPSKMARAQAEHWELPEFG